VRQLPPIVLAIAFAAIVVAVTAIARRLPVPASALIDAVYAPVTLTVDHTFVPKTIARLHNPDARELGIRVFAAYFQQP